MLFDVVSLKGEHLSLKGEHLSLKGEHFSLKGEHLSLKGEHTGVCVCSPFKERWSAFKAQVKGEPPPCVLSFKERCSPFKE